jgi:hypothetical protein
MGMASGLAGKQRLRAEARRAAEAVLAKDLRETPGIKVSSGNSDDFRQRRRLLTGSV